MPITFVEDPVAAEHHANGLKLEGRKAFEPAHVEFAAANLAIKRSPLAAAHSASMILQLARIDRDDGFTSLREAIQLELDSIARLEAGHRRMIGAEMGTLSLLHRGQDSFEPAAWESLESEHGATLGTLYRACVVNTVIFKREETLIAEPETYVGGDPEKDAWHHLEQGSNRYYSANHAMNVARYEVIKGNRTKAHDWHDRATAQIVLARENDPANVRAVQRTVYARRIHLLGQRVAIASIRRQP